MTRALLLTIAWIAIALGTARMFGLVAHNGAHDRDKNAPTYGGLPR